MQSTHHPHQPENVTTVLVWAVTAETHRPQYTVGLDARFINMPFLALPRRSVTTEKGGREGLKCFVFFWGGAE